MEGVIKFMGFDLPTLADGRVYISDNMVRRHQNNAWFAEFMRRNDLKELWLRRDDLGCWVLDVTEEQRKELEARHTFPERFSVPFKK